MWRRTKEKVLEEMDSYLSDDDDLDLTDTKGNKISKTENNDSLITIEDDTSTERNQTIIINLDSPEKIHKCKQVKDDLGNYSNKAKINDYIIDLDSFVEGQEGSSAFQYESTSRSEGISVTKAEDLSTQIIPVSKVTEELEDYEDVVSDSDSDILLPVIWDHGKSDKKIKDSGKNFGVHEQNQMAKISDESEENESCFTPGKSFLVKVKKADKLCEKVESNKHKSIDDMSLPKKSSYKKKVTISRASCEKTESDLKNKHEDDFQELSGCIEASESLPELCHSAGVDRIKSKTEMNDLSTSKIRFKKSSNRSATEEHFDAKKNDNKVPKRRGNEHDTCSKDVSDGASKPKKTRISAKESRTVLPKLDQSVNCPKSPECLAPAVHVSLDDLLTGIKRDGSQSKKEPIQKAIKIKVMRSEDVIKIPSSFRDMEADIERVLEMFPSMQAEVVRQKFRQITSQFQDNILERVVDSLVTDSESVQAATAEIPALTVHNPSTEEDIQILLGNPKITIRVSKDGNNAKEESSKPSDKEVPFTRYAKGSKTGDGSKGKAPAKKKKTPPSTISNPVLSSDSHEEGRVNQDVNMEESSMEIQGDIPDLPDLEDLSSDVTDSTQNASSKKDTDNEVTSSVLECEVCKETENANTVVQCCDGHLVCSKCVEKQVKLVLAPTNKENEVSCPAENCLTYIPESQAKKVLPNLIMELLQEKFHKQAVESITKMEDLHCCPFCEFPVLVEHEIKEFDCLNPSCKKKSCRYCKRPWQFADHSHCDRFTTQEDDTEEFTLPKYWHPMEDAASESFLTVQLDPNSREYSRVHDLCKNALKKITSIRRIQNPRLWQKFSLTRKHMLEDIGRQELNEKQLFHGTNYLAIEGICKEGLDWRMCGINGTAFGQGTYFAKDAHYSDGYSNVVNSLDVAQGTNLVFGTNAQQPFSFGQNSGQNSAGRGFGSNPQLVMNRNVQQQQGSLLISSHNINANVYNPSKPPVLMIPKSFLFTNTSNVGLLFGAGTGFGSGNQQSQSVGFGQAGTQSQQQQPSFGTTAPGTGFGTHNPSTGFGSQNSSTGFGSQSSASGFGSQNPISGFGTITYGTTFGPKPAIGPCDSTQNDNNDGITSKIQKILKKGHKYMFIARVLVGKSTQGVSGLRKPPIDQADPKKRHFNSCVNHVQNPTIFVIFDSSQCYPEYLVEYQGSGRGRR